MAVPSFARTVASGSADTFPVPFPYLDKSHVQVYVNEVLLSPSEYTWPTDGSIKITAGNPTAGAIVERRRATPDDPMTNFEPGNLDVTDLNVASLQPLYRAQEGSDKAGDSLTRSWVTEGLGEGGIISKGAIGSVPKFDADGNLTGAVDAVDIENAEANAAAALASATAAEGSATDAAASLAALETDRRIVETVNAVGGHGVPGEGWAQRFFLILNDALDAIAAGVIARGLRLAHKFGGATMTGARIAAEFSAIHEAVDHPDNAVKQGVALTGSAYGWAAGGWGGTAMSPKGALYGGNFIVTTINGYTYTDNITGLEVNTQMEDGSSTHYKSGIQVVSRDEVYASGPDVGVAVSSITGAVGYKQGLSFGDMNGSPPVPTTGTLIGDYTRLGGNHTAAKGIDFTHWLFTQYIMQFKTWALLPTGSSMMGDGSGQVQIDSRTHKHSVTQALNDFDARLAFSGGQDSVNGGGIASLVAALILMEGKTEIANVPGQLASNGHWAISFDNTNAFLRGRKTDGSHVIINLGAWGPG